MSAPVHKVKVTIYIDLYYLSRLINSLHFKGTHRPNREYHPIQEIVLHNLGVLGNQIFIKLLDFMKIKCSLNWQIFNVICRDMHNFKTPSYGKCSEELLLVL